MTISPWSDVLTQEDRVLTVQLHTWREDGHHHLGGGVCVGGAAAEEFCLLLLS